MDITIEGEPDFDPNEEVAQFVLVELAQTYVDTPLQAKFISSVIRYVRDEGLHDPDINPVAVTYLIKHLYGILEQVGK